MSKAAPPSAETLDHHDNGVDPFCGLPSLLRSGSPVWPGILFLFIACCFPSSSRYAHRGLDGGNSLPELDVLHFPHPGWSRGECLAHALSSLRGIT